MLNITYSNRLYYFEYDNLGRSDLNIKLCYFYAKYGKSCLQKRLIINNKEYYFTTYEKCFSISGNHYSPLRNIIEHDDKCYGVFFKLFTVNH